MAEVVELYRVFRPKLFKHVYGQPEAVQQLMTMLANESLPHVLLFTGPSGCGKTTLARIMQTKLGCGDDDYTEMNAAEERGINTIRDIKRRKHLSPRGGKAGCRIYYLDECHNLTSEAQQAFLKDLEDTPSWVYFFLATTDPGKLIPTIRTRCTEIKVKPVGDEDMEKLIQEVWTRAGYQEPLSSEVVAMLTTVAEGSARKALVILHQIKDLPEADMLEAVSKSEHRAIAFNLAQALMNKRTTWAEIGRLLNSFEEEPETARRIVLEYARKCLIGNGWKDRAAAIINAFRFNFYDSGKAGLALACHEVLPK